MAFAMEYHESPLPHDTLPPLHRRYPRSVLYVQTSPFISDTQKPIYSTNHGQTNSSRTSASRPVMQLTFPQDVRDLSASPHPRPYLVWSTSYRNWRICIFLFLFLVLTGFIVFGIIVAESQSFLRPSHPLLSCRHLIHTRWSECNNWHSAPHPFLVFISISI